MKCFLLCFVPLFIAVDATGTIPILISLTEGIKAATRRRIIFQSLITATAVVVIFLGFGPTLLTFLGITVPDFMIAGGALLFAISLSDMLSEGKKQRRIDPSAFGAVPLGVPLIAGPAVLTTCMLLVNNYGRMLTLLAVLLNIAIAGIVFLFAGPISRFLGTAGTKTVSKIASLLLASIAIMLVRKGIVEIVTDLMR